MEQKPSKGRIVLYMPDQREGMGTDTIVAVVTDGWPDGRACLRLLPSSVEELPRRSFIPFSPDPKPGHWSWPPRV